jgi:hypothetical protein
MPDEDRRELTHLVLVAGHAVYVAEDFRAPASDASWCLQKFQIGEPPFYIEHMREGVRLTAEDPAALLVFSGGQTRDEAGPIGEALSYWRVSKHFSWWGSASAGLRVATEEYARDSFENLLFGICRFRECTGVLPLQITVVSWGFKEARFVLHRDALRFPSDRFHFYGPSNPVDIDKARHNEEKTVALFAEYPYGTCEALEQKRMERNPFCRTPAYAATCPELAGLLRHRGPGRYRGKLPW